MKLSSLSKSPPCPGSDFPESFTPKFLLNIDSTKSPKVPKIITIRAIAKLSNIDKGKNLFKKKATIKVIKAPPRLPSQDFFGNILSHNACLFFLKTKQPNRYANESLIHISAKITINKYRELSKILSPNAITLFFKVKKGIRIKGIVKYTNDKIEIDRLFNTLVFFSYKAIMKLIKINGKKNHRYLISH